MNKLSHDQIANHFYNLGAQLALGSAGMSKTAGISANALRKALSGGAEQSAAIGRALAERQAGQMGTLYGSTSGLGAGLAAGGDNLLLSLLLAGAGSAAGGAAGNIVGRRVGGVLGQGAGYVGGLEPFRSVGNFLADPLRRVPGIRG